MKYISTLILLTVLILTSCKTTESDSSHSGSEVKKLDNISEKPVSQKSAEITMPLPIVIGKIEIFYYDKPEDSNLYDSLIEYLDKVAGFLQTNHGYTIRIIGHSDNSLSMEKNYEISKIRAKKVTDYLISKGISKKHILSTGRGPIQPIAKNNNEEGRRKNRRVEILVMKN